MVECYKKSVQKNKSDENHIINPQKFKKIILLSFMFCIFFTFFIISLYSLLNWLKDGISSTDLLEDILETTTITEVSSSENVELISSPSSINDDYWNFIKMPLINVEFDSLLKRNKDTVAWIKVNNTNINYPVVQSTDNSYYLNKAFDGTTNHAGWIFADYRNNMKEFDRNTIIYGHSRLNQTMFGSLKNVLQKSWYENKSNYIINLSTPTENTMWQIFSVYTIEPESYYITTSFLTDESYQTFLNTIQSRSIYDFSVQLSNDDKILTLSTCSNLSGTGRIVVHSKLIKREIR